MHPTYRFAAELGVEADLAISPHSTRGNIPCKLGNSHSIWGCLRYPLISPETWTGPVSGHIVGYSYGWGVSSGIFHILVAETLNPHATEGNGEMRTEFLPSKHGAFRYAISSPKEALCVLYIRRRESDLSRKYLNAPQAIP